MRSLKVLTVFLIIAAMTGLSVRHSINIAVAPSAPVSIRIEPGTSALEISSTLKENDIIASRGIFLGLTAAKGRLKKLQAGTYVFEGERRPAEIIDILFRGKIRQIRFTVPEGSDILSLAAIVSSTGIVSRADFIATAMSPATVEFFGIEAPSMEGFLYPDTYFITEGMTALEVIARMFNRFTVGYAAALKADEPAARLTQLETVTLASLIEKEAVVKDEKPIISSVFHNRLKKRMRLQSDPTAIYGIENFEGPITASDLKRQSPHNTYQHAGLPPGPICSPQADSISAALYPAETSYLYFVATGSGRHVFSCSLKEHNRAVARIRQARKS